MTTEFARFMAENYGRTMLYLRTEGLPEGQYVAVVRMAFNERIITGDLHDHWNIRDAWCYEPGKALAAARAWDGEGEPAGWKKHPATGRFREGGDPAREYLQHEPRDARTRREQT